MIRSLDNYGFHVTHHECEGFVGATLAATQLCDCGFVGSVAGYEEPSEPFYGENFPFAEQCAHLANNLQGF